MVILPLDADGALELEIDVKDTFEDMTMDDYQFALTGQTDFSKTFDNIMQ